MAKYSPDAQMVRVTVRVPKNTLDELDQHVLEAGVYRTYFLSVALVMGARMLAQVGYSVVAPGLGERDRELEDRARVAAEDEAAELQRVEVREKLAARARRQRVPRA